MFIVAQEVSISTSLKKLQHSHPKFPPKKKLKQLITSQFLPNKEIKIISTKPIPTG
jgi:hypothetical protein